MKKICILLTATLLAALAQSAETWRAPASGSAERKQVADALRESLKFVDAKASSGQFFFKELCISDKAGWLEAKPQSAYGKTSAATMSAKLEKKDGTWQVAQFACAHSDCPAGTDAASLRKAVAPQCK